MSKARGYTVLIKRSAEKELDRLPARTFERLTRAILKLEHDPRPKRSRKLRGPGSLKLGARL